MKRLFYGMALLFVVLCGSRDLSSASELTDPSEPSLHEAVWQAALLAVQQRGLSVVSASFEEGHIITTFAPLTSEALAQLALLPDQGQSERWSGGEYRYEVNLGNRLQGMRVNVSAAIRAWERVEQGLDRKTRQALQSNRSLEQAFLNAFTEALRQGATE